MGIKRIRASNFKSFKDLELELGKFKILIGANASGKSNLVHLLKFLRDLNDFGLENAISMQGGIEYFRNIKIGSSKDFSLEVVVDEDHSYMTSKEEIGVRAFETTYNFVLKFNESGTGFKITEEKLSQKCDFHRRKAHRGRMVIGETFGQGEIIVSRVKNKPELIFNPPRGVGIKSDEIFQIFASQQSLKQKMLKSRKLLIEDPLFLIGYGLQMNLGGISIYNFDPRLSQKSQTITGKAELEQDASNLAIILRSILRRKEGKRKFFNLLNELLPFIADLSVQEFTDKSLLFKMRETYFGMKFLPASLVSDGTINMIALLIALYFEKKPVAVIEEPERNIHPYLISKLMDMMKEASQAKQIILTTHNPEMVRNADLESILLISRDKQGFSAISRPSEKEEVKAFLQDDMGVDELYVQNLLSA